MFLDYKRDRHCIMYTLAFQETLNTPSIWHLVGHDVGITGPLTTFKKYSIRALQIFPDFDGSGELDFMDEYVERAKSTL